MKNRFLFLISGMLFITINICARNFIHPGILHTKESLEYVKEKVFVEQENPWLRSYRAFSASGKASKQYKMLGPTKIVTRDSNISNADGIDYKNIIENDAYAIYCQALMWQLTGEEVYAEKAIEMLNAWSAELEEIKGADLELTVSFNGFAMCSGAELMLDYKGWNEEDIEKCRTMFRTIWYPHIKTIERVNGQGTWDSANMKAVLAFAVFLEDEEMFDSVLDYFYNGAGNGTINNYFIDFAELPDYAEEYGHFAETQECGRAQGYAQLGMCNFEEVCEIAYNQGHPELWAGRENIIMKAFEYIACYNLGFDVPYVRFEGVYPGTSFPYISTNGRGGFKPIYYMAYNHYHNRLGLEMPYTKQVIEEKQPYETTHATITDGMGWGTLFFNNPDQVTLSIDTDKENSSYYAFTDGARIYLTGVEAGDRVSLYGVTGHLFESKRVDNTETVFNISGSNYYIINISGKNGNTALKAVVK